ncbi:endoplasmic reticulum metallopeptidase 1-like isoform 1-T1 [Clarias gariepinus]
MNPDTELQMLNTSLNNVSDENGETPERRESSDSEETKKNHPCACILREGVACALVLVFMCALVVPVYVCMKQLVIGKPTEFNATRAREYLESITSVGPRPVGSAENEIMTVNFLLKQLEWVRNESIDGPNTITVERRKHRGSRGFKYYDQITNIVVRLEPRGGAEHFVLANCHFDSVPDSPGANDDAVSCAVMLEVLHSISNLSIPLNHGIIFLFNGVEEIGLMASHAFVTQHEVVKQIRAFVNLEACGVGGKELVFQTGPENPWLVQAYADAVKHPFASVLGQEIFQSGVIPSDTDFRIFTEIGNIPGIDLAFIESGYLYHTKYDTPDRIPTDSIQRAGDNILALLKHLVTMKTLADPSENRNGSMVFFDVLGLTMVVYPARVGSIINYVVAVAALIYLAKKCLWPKEVWGWYLLELFCGSFVFVLSWVMAVLAVLGVAWVVTRMGRSMFWFTHFYASIGLYGSVAAGKILLIHTLARMLYYRVRHIGHAQNKQSLKLSDLFFDVSLLLWCCALIFLTQRGLCSAYIPMLMVFFPLVTKLLLCRHFAQKGVSKIYMLFYLLGLSLPCIHLLYLIWIVFEVFTPIMGRLGSDIPPDIVIAALIAITTALLSSYLIHLLYLASTTKHALAALYAIFVLMFVLVSCGVFFPYSSNPASPRPKRVEVQHLTITCHALNGSLEKTDSGYQIDGPDYTGMSHITPHITDINTTTHSYELPFCGFNKLFYSATKKSLYLPAPAVSPKSPLEFKLVSKNISTRGTVRLSFEAKGPSLMTMFVQAHRGYTLTSWSFKNIPGYYVWYTRGVDKGPWTFWIEVVNSEYSEYLEDTGMVSIMISAHYLFGEDQHTPELNLFLQNFPDWAFVTSRVSTYHVYKY